MTPAPGVNVLPSTKESAPAENLKQRIQIVRPTASVLLNKKNYPPDCAS
jgi:hypothetical protein